MKMHSSAGRKMEATMKIIVSGVMQRGKFCISVKKSLYWDYLVEHMPNPDNLGVDDRRAQFNIYLSQLKHWK